jgi:hypothetical protein
MNSSSRYVLQALVLSAAATASAQYAPPPPPRPFAGFLNEYLRKDDPYMAAWDFGGTVRLRYETRDGFGIAGSPGSMDFRENGADVSNAYLLSRVRLRAGYTSKWWGALAEGRSSAVADDDRVASLAPVRKEGHGPESDTIDLHQAYVTLGNHKEFPVSMKVGRQELSYGEERIVGAFGWNNIGRVFDAAKVRWQNEWFGVDAFGSRVVIPEDERFNVVNDYDWFWGFYASSTQIPKHTVDLYFLGRNASVQALTAEPSPQAPQPSARDIYTLGIRFKSLPAQFGPWDYTLDLIAAMCGRVPRPSVWNIRPTLPWLRADTPSPKPGARRVWDWNTPMALVITMSPMANTAPSRISFPPTTSFTVTPTFVPCKTCMTCAPFCNSSRMRR